MSSVPFEPEAPPQRALYMHEVYSRARLASTDEAVCRYCEGMALLSAPCNGPSRCPYTSSSPASATRAAQRNAYTKALLSRR